MIWLWRTGHTTPARTSGARGYLPRPPLHYVQYILWCENKCSFDCVSTTMSGLLLPLLDALKVFMIIEGCGPTRGCTNLIIFECDNNAATTS